MIKIRESVFETNSSSTHSITITSEENYNAWRAGLVKYNEWEEKFIVPKELTDAEKRECAEKYQQNKPSFYKDWKDLSEEDRKSRYAEYADEHHAEDEDLVTYEEWRARHSGCDFSTVHHTTEHGDKVVAFGYGGYDG